MKYLLIAVMVIGLQGCVTIRITTVETVNIIQGGELMEEDEGGYSI